MRYELSDHEWTAIKPMLPNKPLTRSRQAAPRENVHPRQSNLTFGE